MARYETDHVTLLIIVIENSIFSTILIFPLGPCEVFKRGFGGINALPSFFVKCSFGIKIRFNHKKWRNDLKIDQKMF
jgi:hypothetical protein